MKINFVTSGFPNGFTDEFIHELKKHLTSTENFVFIASDFSRHPITRHYLERFLTHFQHKAITFQNSYIVDFELLPEEAKKRIAEADVVWLSGGPTITQITHINDYGLVEALQNRSGITIGMSAGSINMAKQVVLARDINDNVPELSIYDGIGLVDVHIEPHLNEASEEHIRDIEEAALHAPIYGLYDESFIVDADGDITVFGDYKLFGRNT